MANLAIKGHLTRGEEVIETLAMLGGSNAFGHIGNNKRAIYYINEAYKNSITCSETKKVCDCIIFTFEEFEQKFPYKVGDKVLYKTYGIYSKIKTMLWNVEKEQVFYRLESNKLFVATADELQPHKEETADKTNKATFDYNAQCCDIMNHLIKEKTIEEIIKINIPAGYEFAGVDDNNQQVIFEKIGCQYPKTYEECCKVLGIRSDWHLTLELDTPATHDLIVTKEFDYVIKLESLRKLSICRDAYWKIAGEQMELDKPWEPDWSTESEVKYVIEVYRNNVRKNSQGYSNTIFAFPTVEMRDAFKENFDDDIECCKEFL